MTGYVFPEIVTRFNRLNNKCMAAFEPIKQFKDIDFELTNKEENELLEYVIMVADEFFPCYDVEYDVECTSPLPSLYTREFKAYYNQKDGLVYPITVEEYTGDKTIQRYLKNAKIDMEKFWYLLLFVYNHCHNLCKIGHRIDRTSSNEELKKALDYLKENFCLASKKIKVKNLKNMEHRKVSITIKREGKDAITISHEIAIWQLVNWDAVTTGVDFLDVTSEVPVDCGKRAFAFHFDKLMNWFLYSLEPDEEKNEEKRNDQQKIYFIEDLLIATGIIKESDMYPDKLLEEERQLNEEGNDKKMRKERKSDIEGRKMRYRFDWLRDIRRKNKGKTGTISPKFF